MASVAGPKYTDFKAAEPALKATFKEIEPTYEIRVAPIEGLDLFYSDGTAANYTAKIVVERPPHGLTSSWYFTPSGPDYKFPDKYDAVWRAWIAAVVAAPC